MAQHWKDVTNAQLQGGPQVRTNMTVYNITNLEVQFICNSTEISQGYS